MNLRCTFCRAAFEAEVEDGHSCCPTCYVSGYACTNRKCGARWDSQGDVLTPSKILVS